MANLIKSRGTAWCAFILVIILIVLTALMRGPWWTFIDVFFAFLMTFFHLMALYLEKATAMSRKLDLWAFIFGICSVVAFIAEYFISQ